MKLSKKRILPFATCLALTALFVVPMLVGAQINVNDQTLINTQLPRQGVGAIVISLMNWLLWVVLFIAIIGFVISGILFITAGGSDRAEGARKWLMNSIIGVVVALVGLIAIYFIHDFLVGNL